MNNLSIWRSRIDKALALQNKQHGMWKDAVNLFNCTYFDKLYGGTDPERIDVHFANWYISNLIPLVYFRDPYLFIKARQDQYLAFAETLEEVLNIIWRELKLKQQFKKAIQSAFMTPPGWIKLGYTARLGEDVSDIEKIKEKSFIREIKDAITGVFTDRKESLPEEKGELNMFIKEESIFATWISSWNILVPPGYHMISQMPYLIEIEDLPMIDFKLNPLYKNKDKGKPSREIQDKTQGVLVKPTYHETTPSGKDDEFQIIRLYHIWDRRGQERITISDNEEHFRGGWPYDLSGFPYKPLTLEDSLPQPDESNPYPPNALLPIMPQIIEKAQARTMMVKYRKRANVFILVPDTFTDEQIGQLEENESVQIIKVPMTASPITPGTIPNLPPDVYNIDSINDKDLQMATNMGQLMFQPLPGQRTATQAQIAQSGLQLKASARVDTVEDYTVDIATGLSQLLWQFYSREKISEILGKPVTSNMWPNLPKDRFERRRIIQSGMIIRIDAGSTAPPKDETVDRKQILDFASIVASIAPERIKKDEFIKQLAKRFKFVKDVDTIVISNDEGEIQSAQKENELMAQGSPQVVSPNENHEIHIQVHSQMPPNKLGDVHVSEHAQFMGITQKPQEGDRRPPTQSTKPEKVREAPPTEGDIYQSVQNLGAGTGT